MIAAYKKFGDSGASDIPPGLLDTFYVEPAFAPEIYREVVDEPSDERKSAGLYSSEAFTDPDGFTGSYSKSMPVSGKADKNPAISGGRPGNAFAFDPSIATDWALLMEDEDSDAEEGKSTEYDANSVLSEGKASTLTADKEDVAPSILNKLAPPPGLLNYSAFPPPPGFPMHNESVSTTVSSENKYEKEAGRSAVEDEVRLPELESVSCSPRPVYRHLVLQPRSIPIASIKVTEEPRTST